MFVSNKQIVKSFLCKKEKNELSIEKMKCKYRKCKKDNIFLPTFNRK